MKNPVRLLSLLIISALFLSVNFFYSNKAQASLNLNGRILLQVEDLGQAWYVNPLDASRYYLGRPDDAFSLMRRFGLGVSIEI